MKAGPLPEIDKSTLKPLTDQQKANPLGAHLLQHYYTTKTSFGSDRPKAIHPIYNVNDPKDIPLIMHCAAEEGLTTYGIVVVTGGRHRTPVLVHNDDAYIFESLGTSRSKVGISSVAQIAIAIEKSPHQMNNIKTFRDNRQVDSLSCGSDSFMVLKEAFKITEELEGFSENQPSADLELDQSKIIDKEPKEDPFYDSQVHITQLEQLPPTIAKYAQTQSAIANYPGRFKKIKMGEKYGDELETVQEYALRHKKEVSIDTPEKKPKELYDEKVELKGRRITATNAAIDNRRQKHARLLKEMLSNLDVPKIIDIVKESSGINLIEKHLQTIPKELIEKETFNETKYQTTSGSDLTMLYIIDEISKKRDERTGIAPKGILSLTEFAGEQKAKFEHQMKHPTSKKLS